jgi:rubrerythrin
MTDLSNVDEILEFAIGEEQAAVDFYTNLADMVKAPAMQEVFLQFAKEERGHKAKLESVKAGKKLATSRKQVQDLKISDYVVPEEPRVDIDYAGALVLAMKKEKAAFRLYNDLAARADDPAIKDLLLGLAEEEARHKLRFEVEYDDYVLRQN